MAIPFSMLIFSLQIANVLHLDTVRNTIPICVFNEKDTLANLETALGMYQEQLAELMTSTWREKSVKVFLFGDYEFQTVNYGLSGSSGTRPCLHCLCTKIMIEIPQEEWPHVQSTPRTLAALTGMARK